MRISLPNFAVGLALGLLIGPVLAEQLVARLFVRDRVVLKESLAFCHEEAFLALPARNAKCSSKDQSGGLQAGTIIEVDSKGFGYLTFRIAPIADTQERIPSEPPAALLILARPAPPPADGPQPGP